MLSKWHFQESFLTSVWFRLTCCFTCHLLSLCSVTRDLLIYISWQTEFLESEDYVLINFILSWLGSVWSMVDIIFWMKFGRMEFPPSSSHSWGKVLTLFWGSGSHLAKLTEEGFYKKVKAMYYYNSENRWLVAIRWGT